MTEINTQPSREYPLVLAQYTQAIAARFRCPNCQLVNQTSRLEFMQELQTTDGMIVECARCKKPARVRLSPLSLDSATYKSIHASMQRPRSI